MISESVHFIQTVSERTARLMYRNRYLVLYLFLLLAFFPNSAYAAESDPFAVISNLISEIYAKILPFSTGLAILLTVWALIRRMMAEGQEKAMITRHIRDIWISWFIINMLGTIVSYASSFIDGNGVDPSSLDSIGPNLN